MHVFPRRLARRATVLALTFGLAGAAGAAHGALPASSADPTSASMAAQVSELTPTTVTLISGDVVEVIDTGGARPTVRMTPPDGVPGRSYARFFDPQGDAHVIPSGIQALVGEVLDPDLFNVSLLIRDGYDDASSPSLPVIIEYEDAPVALPGTRVVRELDSINGAALDVDRATGAPALGRALERAAEARSINGVTKIWLDGRVTASLDESVPQVGAPEVWDRGFTGAGITIGIVDSGIDAEHPDLAGRVVAAENFTSADGVTDQLGHGTHVASIAAGDGAASAGQFTGVAYDAELVNARVLNENGEGTESWVIAGIEWAAVEQDADVINMSLNSGPSDGTDPVSQAIDALSDETGALFVVSAGNEGYGTPGSVYAPATADAALAVGAVDKQDRLADFSAIGPRLGRFGVKPEIVAPGVDITAAQAEEAQIGEPVGDDYLILSGTSMAAPHVAGAAALLLQAEPDLTWSGLKARLVTSGEDLGLATFEQGGGRLDVPAAFDQTVQSDLATINLGTLEFPHDDGETSTRQVTLTNIGADDVDADLEVSATGPDGQPAPAGMLSVEPAQLVVPAGGSATATVTFDAALGDVGAYGGVLLASSGGTELLRIPLGFEKEAEKYDLTVDVLGADGTLDFDGNLALLSLEDESLYEFIPVGHDEVGSVTFRLPRGSYGAMLQLFQEGPDGPAVYDVSAPEFALTGDTVVTLAASDTVEITAEITDEVTQIDAGVGFVRSSESGLGFLSYYDVVGIPGVRAFAKPTEPVTLGEYAFQSYQTFVGDGVSYHLVHPENGSIPADLSYPAGPDDLARIDHALHADVPGRAYQMSLFGTTEEFANEASPIEVDAADAHTTWVTGDPANWQVVVDAAEPPARAELTVVDRRYEAGTVSREEWFAQPVRPGARDGMPPVGRFGDSMIFEVYPFVDPGHHFGYTDPGIEEPSIDRGKYKLSTGGEVISSGTDLGGIFVKGVPPERAEYMFELSVKRSADWWVMSPETTTDWTFWSEFSDGEAYPTMLQVDYGVDVDLLNQVPAGPVPVTFDAYVPGFDVPAPPADLESFQAWSSLDDGATWSELALGETGPGAYQSEVDASTCVEVCLVTLRVAAEDTEGATIDQTITRAFRAVAGATPPPTTGTPTPTVTTTLPGTGAGDAPWLATLGLGALLAGGLVVAISARRLRASQT